MLFFFKPEIKVVAFWIGNIKRASLKGRKQSAYCCCSPALLTYCLPKGMDKGRCQQQSLFTHNSTCYVDVSYIQVVLQFIHPKEFQFPLRRFWWHSTYWCACFFCTSDPETLQHWSILALKITQNSLLCTDLGLSDPKLSSSGSSVKRGHSPDIHYNNLQHRKQPHQQTYKHGLIQRSKDNPQLIM